MAELAVADNVFLFLTESVVGSENFYQEEFYIRKIHNLITDFLALMPMKVSFFLQIAVLEECGHVFYSSKLRSENVENLTSAFKTLLWNP